MWEQNNYTLRFRRNPFYRHEQAILASAGFDGFLPMTFLRSEQGLTARYECSGFTPLSSFRIERTEDVLYLMEKVFLVLHRAPEYLLDTERILLRTELIFYSREGDDLKIAYVPRPQAFRKSILPTCTFTISRPVRSRRSANNSSRRSGLMRAIFS